MEDLYVLIRRQDDPEFRVYNNEEAQMIISSERRDYKRFFTFKKPSLYYFCSAETEFDQEMNMAEAVFQSKVHIRREEKLKNISNLLRKCPLQFSSRTPVSNTANELKIDKNNQKLDDINRIGKSEGPNTNSYERPTHAERVFLGRIPGILTLWRSGSVLKWTARKDNWCSPSDGVAALRACTWA